MQLDRALLKQIVEQDSKQRFSWLASAHGLNDKIRAAHGHSVPVNLGLSPGVPPICLYHGTTEVAWQEIKVKGLDKRKRQQVHLSSDI